jgi:hypothetical protein
VIPGSNRRRADFADPSLPAFVEHARRFGVESVYETAEYWLGPEERASLTLHLRRLDPRWKLEREGRERLVRHLAESGATDQKIGEALGIRREAANAARAELATLRPANDVNKPEKCAVFAGCVHLPVYPENHTPHAPESWQSWVYGGARIRHVRSRR